MACEGTCIPQSGTDDSAPTKRAGGAEDRNVYKRAYYYFRDRKVWYMVYATYAVDTDHAVLHRWGWKHGFPCGQVSCGVVWRTSSGISTWDGRGAGMILFLAFIYALERLFGKEVCYYVLRFFARWTWKDD